MKPSTQALSAMSAACYRSARARLRDGHAFGASMSLIHGNEGSMLSGGGYVNWPGEKRDALRAKFRAAHEDIALSLALWKVAGRLQRAWERDIRRASYEQD